MHIDTDQQDDSNECEIITDPIIKRYAHQIHLLTQGLISETEHYELNRVQINQIIDSLSTIRNLLVIAEDLERLDAMLRMSFPSDYYGVNDSVVSMLTDYPISTSN